jgi:hypothetical protein
MKWVAVVQRDNATEPNSDPAVHVLGRHELRDVGHLVHEACLVALRGRPAVEAISPHALRR